MTSEVITARVPIIILFLCGGGVLTAPNKNVKFAKSTLFPVRQNENADFWMNKGRNELELALKSQFSKSDEIPRAKNIIIFIGDGMSMTTVTASRIYKGQQKYGTSGEDTDLTFDKFPNIGTIRTYTTDYQVPDSASTASAIFHGVKTNYYTTGYDNSIVYNDPSSMKTARKVDSIFTWAQNAGKKTGIVTNTRLTHATPAAMYSHSASRRWECDKKLPENATEDVKDLARQLTEDLPGRDVNVVLGGGLASLRPRQPKKYDQWACARGDGRTLLSMWKQDKINKGKSAKVVTNLDDFRNVDHDQTDYLMGVFSESNLEYEDLRDKNSEPSLAEMTETAVKMLENSQHGYFLAVEGGRIDHAHHDGNGNRALSETLAFDEAIEIALKTVDLDETLIIVTADHSHGLSMNGYPDRGADIRGLAGDTQLTVDGLPFTILSYATGPGANIHRNNETGGRVNLTGVDTTGFNFRQASVVPIDIEIHAGDDVGAWAIGPGSKLIYKNHEQSYLGHVMAYAGCIGPYTDRCVQTSASVKEEYLSNSTELIYPSFIMTFFILYITRKILVF